MHVPPQHGARRADDDCLEHGALELSLWSANAKTPGERSCEPGERARPFLQFPLSGGGKRSLLLSAVQRNKRRGNSGRGELMAAVASPPAAVDVCESGDVWCAWSDQMQEYLREKENHGGRKSALIGQEKRRFRAVCFLVPGPNLPTPEK